MSEPGPPSPPPPLRADLEITPIEHEDRPVYLLRDPESDDDKALGVSPAGMAVASLFDGARSAEAIAQEFNRQANAEIPAADVLKIAAQLDAAGLLNTPKSRAARGARLEAFRAAPTRPAMFAGRGGYPKEPIELAGYLAGFFRHAKGPGRPAPETPTKAAILGCFAPHIDLHRGGPAYAWTYGALADAPPPDLIVALGVAHVSPPSPWAFTRKTYETPYGPMAVAGDLYDELAAQLWYDPRDDEWVHRREHSLEFQALWLRYLWRNKTPPWLPILCSSFERFAEDLPPSAVETVEGSLRRIGERLAARAKRQRILILAGVDLAHVGRRFGDDLDVTPELEKRVEAADRASLESALALDADAFYMAGVQDGAWRKVCGLSALYTSLRWIAAAGGSKTRGELLTYGQAPDPTGGIVSFAGGVYRAK